jgi:O-acetyl-ADP-ribose deacetylase (regulator of RNase III)
MPIIFISLSEKFTENIMTHGYKAFTMKIQDYIPNPTKKTYFVSPANCLCFMDGGFDLALSTIIFPNIEKKVKQIVKNLNITNLLERNYLPIGSSIIIDDALNKSLIVSPTMLLPQNVSKTDNAYYCTVAVLNNILINRNENIDDIDIIFTSLCCGYGKMDELKSITQILKGINDYKLYKPIIIDKNIIINEPNLFEQPKIYQNTEWFIINNNDIVQV